MENYFSILKNKVLENEIDINKSRFLGFCKQVENVQEAQDFIKSIKQEYNDARHVVYAYRLFDTSKSTDDGEPSGTAGRPILEYLMHKNLYNIVAVVVRYFGGIKLGTGGLVRAYTQCVSETLDNNIVELKLMRMYKVNTDYTNYQNILGWLKNKQAKLINTNFGEKITADLILAQEYDLPKDCVFDKEIFDYI